MKSLKQIQNELAHEGYNCTFLQALNFLDKTAICLLMEDVAKRYAEEAIKECSTRAKTMKTGNSGSWFDATVDEQSILNIIKELK